VQEKLLRLHPGHSRRPTFLSSSPMPAVPKRSASNSPCIVRAPPAPSATKRSIPYGFALENFDAIGGWRANYSGNHKIDSSGDLPTGEKFTGVTDFRSLLIGRHEQFTRSLTENS